MRLHQIAVLLAPLAVLACSAAPEEVKEETWKGIRSVSAPLTIPLGHTITIEPGTVVQLAAGASITVEGSLRAPGGGKVARLLGKDWGGIIVARGGRLELSGVDIEDPTT